MAYTLQTGTALETTTTGSTFTLRPHAQINPVKGVYLTLDVTVDESTTADKLDVSVDTKVDGENWTTVCSFTQHAGDAGAARYVAKIIGDGVAQAMFTNAALAAGSIRNLIGNEWRSVATITDDSGNAAFTFTVTMEPIY